MAFNKTTQEYQEKIYDLTNKFDRAAIMEFESMIEPYRLKSLPLFTGTVYQLTLTGFDLYLHEKGIFRFTEKYKLGAIGPGKSEVYREAMAKYITLCKLIDQRSYRESEVIVHADSLVNG